VIHCTAAVNSANHFVRLSSFCSPPFDLLPFRSLVMDQPHSLAGGSYRWLRRWSVIRQRQLLDQL